MKFIEYFKDHLLEMAIKRNQALRRIEDQALSLREHILNILATNQYYDWDSTISNILTRVTYLIEASNKPITKDEVFRLLFIRYVKDVNYMKSHTRLLNSKGLAKIKDVPEDEMRTIYSELIDLVFSDEPITKDKIRNIFETYQ